MVRKLAADALDGDPFASGVIIGRVARGSYANRIGFQRGEVVVAIDGRPVTSTQALANLGRGAEVTIQRGGQRVTGVMR